MFKLSVLALAIPAPQFLLNVFDQLVMYLMWEKQQYQRGNLFKSFIPRNNRTEATMSLYSSSAFYIRIAKRKPRLYEK